MGECRDCQAPIRWVRMPTGRAMPVNPQPLRADANLVGRVAAYQAGGNLYGFTITRDRIPTARESLRFTPHAATCAARARHEKPPRPVPPVNPPLF